MPPSRAISTVAESRTISETEISVSCSQWSDTVPDAVALCRLAAGAAIKAASPGGGPVEVSILLADDSTVASLNRDFRHRDGPTNVLSFPAGDPAPASPSPLGGAAPPVLLGDVVLAYETVVVEADEQDKKPADHLTHLVVHGILHLLGYDHEDESDAEIMEAMEITTLVALGIANPYAEEPSLA